jgi:hypothetical protein
MKSFILSLVFILIPVFAFAGWSTPQWTDDCSTVVQKDANGRMSTWTENCYGQDGKLVRQRVDTYTYNADGSQDIINEKILDSKGKSLSDIDIKHYDNPKKQPTVTKKTVEQPEVIK